MNAEWVRQVCMKLPHTTEQIQWGSDLVFKVGGKMYVVVGLEPGKVAMSFKCSLEDFADLIERPGIIPAPYLARAHWVALETDDALSAAELKTQLKRAYEIVLAGLPKKAQTALAGKSKR